MYLVDREDAEIKAVIDSGAEVNVIHPRIVSKYNLK